MDRRAARPDPRSPAELRELADLLHRARDIVHMYGVYGVTSPGQRALLVATCCALGALHAALAKADKVSSA